MKSMNFHVTISFSDEVFEGDEIAKHLAEAILSQVNGAGIAPVDSKAHTETVTVRWDRSDEEFGGRV